MNPQQLLRDITEAVGKLIDARAKTTETIIRGEFKSEIKGLEERLSNKIDATKNELKSEISSLRTGVAKRIIQQDEKIEELKEEVGSSSKH